MKAVTDTLPRKKHDPLPEVPPSPTDLMPNRNRSSSARHYESPVGITREIHSSSSSLVARPSSYVVEDDGLSPYASVRKMSFPRGKCATHLTVCMYVKLYLLTLALSTK